MPTNNPHSDFLIRSGHLNRPYPTPTLCGFHLGFGLGAVQHKRQAGRTNCRLSRGIIAKELVYAGTEETYTELDGLPELALIGVDPGCKVSVTSSGEAIRRHC